MVAKTSSRESGRARVNSSLTPSLCWRTGLILLLGLVAVLRADAACSPATAGLVGWWPGDGNANDIIGTNNGALQGGAAAGTAGIVGSAFSLDGTNGYIQIPDSPALRPTNLTIEGWVKFRSLDSAGSAPAGLQYVVFKQNSRSSDFEGYNLLKIRIAGGDVLAFMLSSSAGQALTLQSATLVSTGLWYHVAGVRGSNFAQLYVNGQLESQTNVSFPQDYGNYPLLFGSSGQSYWEGKLNGSLDEVSLYSRALSATEVAAIYAAGAAGKCKPGGPSITTQAQSQSVAAGSSITFSVTVSGTAPLSYQWQKNGANLADGGNLSGATSSALALANVQTNDAGAYQVVVTNSIGSVTGAVATLTVIPPSPAVPQSADALVLVNSASARYPDFHHYLQPYLDNFGVPYTVLDIATNGVSTNLGYYALLVVGHSQLDTNGVFLGSAGQASISLAVSNGTGLVSFDGVLSAGGSVARYQFVQSIFGFGYGATVSGTSVSTPATEPLSQMHYITALHSAGDVIALRSNMSVPSLVVPSNVTAVALSGTQPLLAVTKYGQGRAAQWASYDWMSTSILGPVDGLDDLIWRSLVWAARKPFVMRGLPNFLTLRMDDVCGPFWWVHTANELGFKPWLGLFLSNVAETNTADLRSLVTNGNATASIHSLDCCSTFFYYDHSAAAPWPDNVMSNYFYTGTQWHVSHGIPISQVVVAHYSEIGPNAFAGLKAWGVQYVNIIFPPGDYWYSSPPWLTAGPYRLYETPRDGTSLLYPAAYADFYSVPGHPEFDGQFFCCVTEIRDDASCGEWCPSDGDVPGSIGRGARQAKRAFDSMVLASLYGHEWYLIPLPQSSNQTPISTNNWRAILQGITNTLAGYNPIYVSYDYACQYVRATRTSRLVAANYDPVLGRVTVSLSGSTDLDTQVSVYVGQDNAINSTSATVPAFSGTTTNLAATLFVPRLSLARTPTNTVVLSWPNPAPGFVLQQNAVFNPTDWIPVTNPAVVVGDRIQVVIPHPANDRFYRLVQP
jgi:hypothetical protein